MSGNLADVGRSRVAKSSQPVCWLRVVKTRRRQGSPARLIADFALAVGGIEESGDASGECSRVIGNGEFPGVREEDGNDFSGSESGGDEATGEGFDEAAIFGEREAAIGGSVNQRCLATVLAATLEDNIVDEAPGGIGVQLGAKHWG